MTLCTTLGVTMKKLCVLISLLFVSSTLLAAGFQDNSGTKVSTIAQALKMRDESFVTIQGSIVKRISSDKYLFKDATGTMTVEIDDEEWAGQDVNSKNKLELQGEIDKDFMSTKLDVDSVRIIK